MATSFVTADTNASIGQPDSDYPLKSKLYMVLPTPEAVIEAGSDTPDDVNWLTHWVATLIEQHARESDDKTFTTWSVTRFDGISGTTFDGIDILTLQGMINLADQWEGLAIQGHEDLQEAMLLHIKQIQEEVRHLCDIPSGEELPSQFGMYAEAEQEAIENILLYGMADSIHLAGQGLREPFRQLGIALYDSQRLPEPPGLMPLCINEHPDSPPALSTVCPFQGEPTNDDEGADRSQSTLSGMRRLAGDGNPMEQINQVTSPGV